MVSSNIPIKSASTSHDVLAGLVIVSRIFSVHSAKHIVCEQVQRTPSRLGCLLSMRGTPLRIPAIPPQPVAVLICSQQRWHAHSYDEESQT